MADGRVLIALGDGPLVAAPTWTRFDDLADCRCYGFDGETGRQSELDTTDTGRARVYFHDRLGVLDSDGLIGLQIQLQLFNPVTSTWVPRWRGHIDDISTVLNPGAPALANVQMDCVGIFDYLGGVKFIPGEMGAYDGTPGATPPGMDAVVYYEVGPVATGTGDPLDGGRIENLLDDAGLAAAMYVIFSGNVDLNDTLYDPDDVILQGLRDAADAEFPGVANVYEDRLGRVVFHGRFARFDPEGTEASAANWDFVRWEAATRADVTTGVAQIRSFAFNRPRARIINSYLAWPREDENGVQFDRSFIPGMVGTDTASIAAYGYRGREAPDLIIREHKTNGNTGADECYLFGQFYVINYALPRKAIRTVSFKSIRPGDARATATWALMCGVDISDAINLTVDEAGLADEPYFVDGVSVSCRPLNPEFDMVTVTPNLTPASYYGTDVFDVGT